MFLELTPASRDVLVRHLSVAQALERKSVRVDFMEYDAKVIVEFASKLYIKAKSIVLTYIVLGALVGAFTGFAATQHGIGAIVGGFIVGAIGYSLGSDKAFQLKLQAQVALCQVQIEKNSRTSV